MRPQLDDLIFEVAEPVVAGRGVGIRPSRASSPAVISAEGSTATTYIGAMLTASATPVVVQFGFANLNDAAT